MGLNESNASYSTHKRMPTKLDSEKVTRGSVALPLLILTMVKSYIKNNFIFIFYMRIENFQ